MDDIFLPTTHDPHPRPTTHDPRPLPTTHDPRHLATLLRWEQKEALATY